jgi:N-acetylglucosaminyldiphosphoundecaprenol N-acetyl-beta-D-mannosaminyltransferase
MTPEEVSAQDSLILESKADIVWVGLGTPRQDFECARITKELGLTTVAVGAAFDFFSGLKKESPKWMTKLGLEWIFRFASEPKRLWRRYLVGNFVFLWAVLLGWSKS